MTMMIETFASFLDRYVSRLNDFINERELQSIANCSIKTYTEVEKGEKPIKLYLGYSSVHVNPVIDEKIDFDTNLAYISFQLQRENVLMPLELRRCHVTKPYDSFTRSILSELREKTLIDTKFYGLAGYMMDFLESQLRNVKSRPLDIKEINCEMSCLEAMAREEEDRRLCQLEL